MDLIDLVIARDLPALRLAIAEGSSVDGRDSQKNTALHVAAQEYALEVMSELLKARADVDARNVYGNTPLLAAVFNSRGRPEAVQMLLDHGANPDAVNEAGRTPRQLAGLIANYDTSWFEDASPSA